VSAARVAPPGPGAAAAEREIEPVLEALLGTGQTLLVPVRGASMRPALKDGDRVAVAPFLGLPRIGQIAVARVAQGLVAHRIVGIEWCGGRRIYRLQGDAEPGRDAGVLREALLGRAAAIVRQGRRLEVAEGPSAVVRARLRRALLRRAPGLARGAAVLLLALLCALGIASAAEEGVAPAPDYRFGPGDVLSIRVWNGQKIDELKLTVQSDGEAFLPVMGIGSLPVSGRTVVELKQELERRFGSIYRETHVELLISKYAGHRVSLMGEVRTTARNDSGPGEWALEGPTRLVAFLSAHGGPSSDADAMRIQLLRRNAERRELNLFRAVFQGSEADDPWLEAGDLIFVPSLAMGNRKVFVLGEVHTPGVVNIIDRMGLVEAIARAGGFTSKGYIGGVVVLKRGAEGQAEMHVADFKRMFKRGRLEADVALQPGDIVFVPRRAIATLQELFSIINPALGIIESIYIIDRFRSD
jgi:polysaccharide export outer membrane protein